MTIAAQPRGPDSTTARIIWYARRTPDATAVIEDGRSFTYAAFAADLSRCVEALRQGGVCPSSLVGIEVRPQHYLQLLLLLACQCLGATATPLLPKDFDPGDPVTPDCDRLLLAKPAADRHAAAAMVIPSDFLDRLAASGAPHCAASVLEQEYDPGQTAWMSRTSGTTGQRKVVLLSRLAQHRIVVNQLARLPEDVRTGIRFLCLYNFGMRATWTRSLRSLHGGGTVIYAREAHAPALLAAGVANLAYFMVGDAERIARQAAPGPHATSPFVELAGAAAGAALRGLLRQRLGARVSLQYASNETNSVADIDEDGIGTLCPGADAMIVDDDGQPVPLGQTGHIRVRTDTLADGYYKDPDLTRTTFVDGWYHSADVGFMPEPGKLVILGRADEMLNIGGLKVPPRPIEDQIRQIDGVTDAALLSIDQGGVNALIVAIELADIAQADAVVTAAAPIVSRHATRYVFLPLPSFPRTENGKVRRPEIETAARRRLGG